MRFASLLTTSFKHLSRRASRRNARRSIPFFWLCPAAASVEQLDDRVLLSSISSYDGGYAGSFKGSVLFDNNSLAVPGTGVSNNSFEAAIDNGIVTVVLPGIGGTGTGTVDASGQFNVSGGGMIQGRATDFVFTGTLTLTATGVTGTGEWHLENSQGLLQGGSGDWQGALRQDSVFDGNYTGSFRGNVNAGFGNSPVPGPLVQDDRVLVKISEGIVDVSVPGISATGRTVIYPNGGAFSVDAVGSLGGSGVAIRYNGTIEVLGTGEIVAEGTWTIVDTPGVTGSGEWDIVQLTLGRPVIDTTSNPQTTSSQRPSVSWTTVEFAASYDVYVNRLSTPGVPTQRVRVTDTNFTPTVDLGIGRSQIWVQAISAAGKRSPWSLPLRIHVNSPVSVLPGPVFAPSARPVLEWQPLDGAATYEIYASNITTRESAILNETGITATSYTPTADLPAGYYVFQVRGRTDTGYYGNWSSVQRLYVGPTAISPIQPSLNSQPEFEWTSFPNVATTDIYIRNQSTAAVSTLTGLTGTSWTPTASLPRGKYFWQVRARYSGSSPGRWSPPAFFNTDGQTRVQVESNPGVNSLISWTPVGSATLYRILVRRDHESRSFQQISTVTETSATINTSQPGTYRVWIQALGPSAVIGRWSNPVTFVISQSGNNATHPADTSEPSIKLAGSSRILHPIIGSILRENEQPSLNFNKSAWPTEPQTSRPADQNNILTSTPHPAATPVVQTEDVVLADWDQLQFQLDQEDRLLNPVVTS